jgi:hypothetical protein
MGLGGGGGGGTGHRCQRLDDRPTMTSFSAPLKETGQGHFLYSDRCLQVVTVMAELLICMLFSTLAAGIKQLYTLFDMMEITQW